MKEGAARLVRALKYSGWTALADRMGPSMAPAARRVAGTGDGAADPPRLVPVPLAPSRRRRRGFNQARRLARPLGRELGWPVDSALQRRRRGRPQARLGRASRGENVAGAFAASPAPPGGGEPPVAVIVDDVVTTGATAGACAGALRRAGWRPAGVVAFARAVGTEPRPPPDVDVATSADESTGLWHGSRDS